MFGELNERIGLKGLEIIEETGEFEAEVEEVEEEPMRSLIFETMAPILSFNQ